MKICSVGLDIKKSPDSMELHRQFAAIMPYCSTGEYWDKDLDVEMVIFYNRKDFMSNLITSQFSLIPLLMFEQVDHQCHHVQQVSARLSRWQTQLRQCGLSIQLPVEERSIRKYAFDAWYTML